MNLELNELTKVMGNNLNRCAFWLRIGTELNPSLDWSAVKHLRKVVYQHEIGKKGNHHFQCYVELMPGYTCRFTQIAKALGLKKGNWFAGTLKGSVDRSKMENYCRKVDTRYKGPWVYPEADSIAAINNYWWALLAENDLVIAALRKRGPAINVQKLLLDAYLAGKMLELGMLQARLDHWRIHD